MRLYIKSELLQIGNHHLTKPSIPWQFKAYLPASAIPGGRPPVGAGGEDLYSVCRAGNLDWLHIYMFLE